MLEWAAGEIDLKYLDESGDRKKGKKTDYVARQYLGSVGKVDNGIVSVNAYGIYENITFAPFAPSRFVILALKKASSHNCPLFYTKCVNS